MFYFDHEKLHVYQDSLKFIVWLTCLIQDNKLKGAVIDHLQRSSQLIALNVAEGIGRFTSTDRCHFFDIARGSALECAASLDVLVAQAQLSIEQVREGKVILKGIVSMIVGLIKNNSNRIHETGISYETHDEELGWYHHYLIFLSDSVGMEGLRL